MRLSVLALVLLYGTFASTTLMHNPGQCIKLGLDCFNKALLRKTQCTKDVMDCVMDLECTDFYSRGDNCMHLYAGCTTGRLALEYFCEKKRNADVSISLFSVALIVSSIVLRKHHQQISLLRPDRNSRARKGQLARQRAIYENRHLRTGGVGAHAMLRVICLFHTTNQQGIQYIVRSRPERWVDTSSDALQTEYFYTIGVERLTTRSIESTIRSRLLKGKTPFSVKGVVRHAIANPFDGRRFYRTYFVGIQVPDASFRFRLLHNEKYEWTSSKDLLAQVARGKISTNVADAVKMSEEGTYIPMAEIYDAEMNVQDVVKVYENLFTDNQRFLLKEASFGVRQMERIYRIYLEIVWPNSLMNFDDFERFFRKHEMRMGSDSKSLYRAFNLSKEDGINFFDFILALAAIQPDTPHGKISGDLRTRYIFRYYCADCENKFARLTRHEIEALLSDIMKAKKSTVPVNNPDLVHKDLDLNKFVAKVGTLKIRGTSNLLRMRKPILIDLSSPGEEQRLPRTPLEPVRRDENGAIYPNQLYPPSNLLLGVTEPRMVEHAVTLLSSLRYFCKMAVDANDRKKAFHWGRMNKRILMKQFIDVCSDATAILQAEDRCLKVNGNLCIFGDLHGRYDDLRQFEAKLWPLGFECSDQKCLFLGNYACKGLYGFEVVAYLAALKVLHPNKIFLLRGAYDTKKMQNQYGFSGELAGKFSFNSSEVFAAATKFFDTLPLACIVNKKIFCCHSGIPHPAEYKEANLLDAMNSLPKTIDGAQLDFGKCIGLQFLFNDLVSESHVNVDEEGFTVAPNGSAHAFLFNEAALMRCLGLMGCTHMVRGGTASPNGVRIQANSRLITIYSASRLLQNKNEASCLIVKENKVRIYTLGRSPLIKTAIPAKTL